MSDVPALDPGAVLWSDSPAEAPLLVLLHGYGSDERDLFGLVRALPPEYAYAAVRAPLSLPWPSPGYSWYAVEGLAEDRPELVSEAARALLDWLDDAVPADRVCGLLGFSQGGAVAVQAMRLAPERFAAIVNLAGYAAGGELPGDEVLAARTVPVFWGRGALDTVIPAPLVDQTAQWLPLHSDLRGRVYPDLAHGVAADEVDDIHAFLESSLG